MGSDCGGDYETLQNFVSTDAFDPVTGNVTSILTATSVAGADFAYQEVDRYSAVDQAYDIPVDYVAFNNGIVTGPVTFTFAGPTNAPALVNGLVTTLYSYSPFTANLNAYDAQGRLLGSTSFSSVQNDETYLNQFYPTYSAVVGFWTSGTIRKPSTSPQWSCQPRRTTDRRIGSGSEL